MIRKDKFLVLDCFFNIYKIVCFLYFIIKCIVVRSENCKLNLWILKNKDLRNCY